MKTLKSTTFILFLIALFPAISMAQKDKDQFNVALSNPGKPFKLNMNLIGGSISINTHSGRDLRIKASPEFSANENFNHVKNQNVNTNINVNVNTNKAATNANSNKSKLLKVTENNNVVLISQQNQLQAIHVDVSIPINSSNLNVSLTGKGNINIDGVTGIIEVTNANGSIQLKNISGSAIATTVNGNISAVFKKVNASAPMAFSTLIGNIDLAFPSLAKASIKLQSDQGIIYSDFILTSTEKVKMNKDKSGVYRANLSGAFRGNINGGGPEITITNMQGNIYLRKSN